MARPIPAPNSGSKRFTPMVLFIYDALVIHFSNPFVWRCPTKKHLLPLFKNNFSKRHLDVGVGNGYFPTRAITHIARSQSGVKRDQHLSLADLSPHSLEAAKHRISSSHPDADIRCVLADAAKPLPVELQRKPFDSASLYLLFHCMPGPTESKAQAIRSVSQVLSDDGVLVGSTVLGKVWEKTKSGYKARPEATQGRLTSFVLGIYNKRGIFDNYEEDPHVFDRVLKENFKQVETKIVGMMLLFRAKNPRRKEKGDE